MNLKKRMSLRGLWIFSITMILCSILIYFVGSFALFPDYIQLSMGQDNQLNLNLPLEANIEPVSLAVVHINQNPVSDNITVKLNDEITIAADELGSADMTISALGLPIKKVTLDVVSDIEVVPCGMTIGVKINTEGIMVLGTGYVTDRNGDAHRPSEGILKSGDLILTANGKALLTKEDLINAIEENNTLNLTLKRNDDIIEASIMPIKDSSNHNKIGVWVRDSTQGIGTMTYYNPDTKKFGALGHGILDVDTKQLMSVKNGEIMKAEIKSIKKGKKGAPGELVGDIQRNNPIGQVKINNEYGLYGTLGSGYDYLPSDPMKIALQNEIHEGPATIRTNIDGTEVREYDVYIESVNRYSTDDSKGMVIKITDTALLSKTSGIVQGMSGSPIIQDDKIIGAVTHVFVQDPSKGYGIFIENMLKQEKGF